MKIHYLQHVPFEDLANIEAWARSRGHDLSKTSLYAGEPLPRMSDFDWLIILGGPMNIYEEDRYPWLSKEKEFIHQAIASDKIVLGICLGAQLMADELGSKVQRNVHREIGWFPVKLTPQSKASRIFRVLPEEFMALHWHGDTFELPPGAVHTAESQACKNQAFELGKAIGLQFHLESSLGSLERLLLNSADELTDGQYVQKPEEILTHLDRFPELCRLMDIFLDNIEKVLG
jgi:GMP synthase-like glutamine amidotransferase